MALYFNGTSIDKVIYNGTEVSTVYFNGTEVWSASVLESISVSQKSNTYPESGDSVSNYIYVTANYSNGSSKNVTSYTVSPSTLSSGTRTYTVSFTDNGVTKTGTISIYTGSWKVADNSTIYWVGINSDPSHTPYIHSQVFSTSGAPLGVRITGYCHAQDSTGQVDSTQTLTEINLPTSSGEFLIINMGYNSTSYNLTISAEYIVQELWGALIAIYYETNKIEYYN